MEGADSQPLPRGLPAALGLRPGHALPISERLGMAPEGDCVVYYLNIHAIDRRPRDDSEARNRCLARLARLSRPGTGSRAGHLPRNPRHPRSVDVQKSGARPYCLVTQIGLDHATLPSSCSTRT